MIPRPIATTLILIFAIVMTINLNGQNSSNSVLQGIQEKIEKAHIADIKQGSLIELPLIEKELKALQERRENFTLSYWIAYLKFKEFIYHSVLKSDKVYSSTALKNGVDELTKIKTKSSDDYALLARLQSCLIPYVGSKKMKLIQELSVNLNRALELDSNNLRANLINGQYDLFTPEMYGGGKKVEGYLLKCLSLPDQSIKNDYLPSWGRNEVYYNLVLFYLQKENKESALKYYKEGIAKYPNDVLLLKLDII